MKITTSQDKNHRTTIDFLNGKVLIDWNLPDKNINTQYCNIVTRSVVVRKQVVPYILYINSFPSFIYLRDQLNSLVIS